MSAKDTIRYQRVDYGFIAVLDGEDIETLSKSLMAGDIQLSANATDAVHDAYDNNGGDQELKVQAVFQVEVRALKVKAPKDWESIRKTVAESRATLDALANPAH